MKIFIIVLLLLFLPLASATNVDLFLNQSFEKNGKNISLIGLTKDKALVCVNNEKAIISKDKIKKVNDVILGLNRVYKDKIKIDIKVLCKDCTCNESCKNIDCFATSPAEIEEKIEEGIIEEETAQKETELIQNTSATVTILVSIFIILLILALILYFLLKR